MPFQRKIYYKSHTKIPERWFRSSSDKTSCTHICTEYVAEDNIYRTTIAVPGEADGKDYLLCKVCLDKFDLEYNMNAARLEEKRQEEHRISLACEAEDRKEMLKVLKVISESLKAFDRVQRRDLPYHVLDELDKTTVGTK
jgi:hypothetical protein